jgi:hypothetical protein
MDDPRFNPAITDADREKYRNYTDDSIRGIKILKALDDDELKEVLKNGASHTVVSRAIGPNTNPSWVTSQAAEELYMRGVIDEKQLDFISEYGGLEGKLEL